MTCTSAICVISSPGTRSENARRAAASTRPGSHPLSAACAAARSWLACSTCARNWASVARRRRRCAMAPPSASAISRTSTTMITISRVSTSGDPTGRALRAAVEESPPDIAEDDLVRRVQPAQEVLAHALAMRALGGRELLAAAIGELREGAAAVILGRASLDVAELREAVDQPRQAAAAQQDAVGDLGHPQPVAVGGPEEHQDLIGGYRQLVLGTHLRIERLRHPGVDLERAAPRRQLLAGQGLSGSRLRGHGPQR